MSKARAKKIKLILFDVDGVLTDGKIWIFPAPAGAQQTTQEHAARHEDEGGFAFRSQSIAFSWFKVIVAGLVKGL